MEMNAKWMGALVAIALLPVPVVASAAEGMVTRANETVVIGQEPDLAVLVGGGVHTYATELNKATDPGAAVECRAVYGMRQIVGAELAYVAGFNNLKNTLETKNANITSMGGEALVRANVGLKNFGVHSWQQTDIIPYVAAGGGFTDTRLTDENGKKLSSVDGVNYQASTTFHIPAAVGVDAIFAKSLTVGVRGGYKYEFGNQTRTDLAKADLQSWQVTGRVGYAF
jgi:hypothetical protein